MKKVSVSLAICSILASMALVTPAANAVEAPSKAENHAQVAAVSPSAASWCPHKARGGAVPIYGGATTNTVINYWGGSTIRYFASGVSSGRQQAIDATWSPSNAMMRIAGNCIY